MNPWQGWWQVREQFAAGKRRVFRWLLTACLILLVGCSSFGGGPKAVTVEQAIALQLQQTQTVLWQELAPDDSRPTPFKVSRVKLKRVDRVSIDQQPAFRVEGTYTLSGKYLNRKLRQPRNPFEVYLRREDERNRWVLLRPTISSPDTPATWESQPLIPQLS